MSLRNLAAAALIALATPALAEEGETAPIDERRPMNPEGKLYVNNVCGTIQVQAWDKNEMHVTGELGYGAERLEVSGEGASLKVEVKPKRGKRVEESSLLIRVPAGARLELEGVSADISVQGTRGALQATSVSGDVHLSTGSAEIVAQSVSGDVTVRSPSRVTKLNSVSGDVHVIGARERITVETVSGNVQLDAVAVSELDLKSVSGDFRLDLEPAATPRIVAETMSGDVELTLSQPPNALVTLKTFSGELSTGYGTIAEEKKRWEQALGSGKGRIDLSSFSGDIRLEGKR